MAEGLGPAKEGQRGKGGTELAVEGRAYEPAGEPEVVLPQCPFCATELPPLGGESDGPALHACRKCLNAVLVRCDGGRTTTEPAPGASDVREAVAPGSVMAGVFSKLNEALDALPVLPEVPQRILAMVHDPLVSVRELSEVIGEDAVISVKVLKLANSAFYASAQEIHELNVACARLGMKLIANTVYAVANGNLYRTSVPAFRELMQALWKHSLATAQCADELSTRLPATDEAALFEAGLVHDIGKLVLLDLITVKYKGNVGRLRESPDLLVDVMNQFHNLVGLHVARRWNLSSAVCFSTYYHDDADNAPAGNVQRFADTVCLATDLARSMGYGLSEEEVSFDDHASAVRLCLSSEELGGISAEIRDRVDTAVDVMGVI